MDPRPKIFISTVTSELKSARDEVAATLRHLHFEPVVQEEFPAHTGVVSTMLERELEPCAAVIQIVGHRYGWQVYGAKSPTEVMSYTHYEAKYAHDHDLPIWYLVTSDSYPPDRQVDEESDKKMLQIAYRIRLKSTGHLYHTVEDLKDVALTVFRMQDDLDKLRPLHCQRSHLLDKDSASQVAGPRSSPPNKQEIEDMMRELLSEFVPALQQARQSSSPEREEREEEDLYKRLATVLGITPEKARREIEELARKTSVDANQSPLDRAKAAYALKDYQAAEALALEAASEAAGKFPPDFAAQAAALCQAGEAATEQIQYPRALEYYRAAAALVSEDREPLAWAGIQSEIGWLLHLSGDYHQQADLMKQVWELGGSVGLSEDPIFLRARHLWACALDSQGKPADAEREHRAVLAIQERVLGQEHPNCLSTRNNLASALHSQGKYAEALQEQRVLLAIQERVAGAEHQDTLASHSNLALGLHFVGRSSESEQEHRAVLAIEERVLGPQHPSTLMSRNNLALVLYFQGKFSEAEREFRVVLAIQEQVLGSEHPDTLKSRLNLSSCLNGSNRHAEAEQEQRAVLAIQERLLGTEHPDTLKNRTSLANVLDSQGKSAEAELEHRAVLAIEERVLGSGHPDASLSCYNLAISLMRQGKTKEALDYAQRAYEGWCTVFGDQHRHSTDAAAMVNHLKTVIRHLR